MEERHPLGVTGHHFGLEFSRGRVVVERRAGACLRQQHRLAVREDAADGARDRGTVRARGAALPARGWCGAGRSVRRFSRRTRHRRGAGGSPGRCRWSRRPDRPPWAASSYCGLQRFARAILELGGNNAAIVAPTADLDRRFAASPSPPWTPPASAAPRCAACSAHESVYYVFVPRLKRAYESVSVGNPLEFGMLVGPDRSAPLTTPCSGPRT